VRSRRSTGEAQPVASGLAGDVKRAEETKASSKRLSDWEEMKDDLEAKAEVQPNEEQELQGLANKPQVKRPLQNQATARTARPT
jgi:hypothetical protein